VQAGTDQTHLHSGERAGRGFDISVATVSTTAWAWVFENLPAKNASPFECLAYPMFVPSLSW
jgi:hypothetical protein